VGPGDNASDRHWSIQASEVTATMSNHLVRAIIGKTPNDKTSTTILILSDLHAWATVDSQ
jgi:hypothetical protein